MIYFSLSYLTLISPLLILNTHLKDILYSISPFWEKERKILFVLLEDKIRKTFRPFRGSKSTSYLVFLEGVRQSTLEYEQLENIQTKLTNYSIVKI